MIQQPIAGSRPRNKWALTVLTLALVCVVWAFWTTLVQTAQRWGQDPMYSHGYLVPGFALMLLWLRREHLARGPLTGSWWGLPLLGAGIALRFYGTYYFYVWYEAISLVPCLAGVFVMVGGRRAWCWAWPALGFLLFMIPLPYRLSVAMTGPLQHIATLGSTFILQTLALPALADGNVIRLNDQEINIVEACSGLRMLVIFFALSTAVALVMRRPLWQKLVIVFSAVPIALVVNVLRITVTGVFFETLGSDWAKAVLHDLAGWFMMPVALALLGLELKLLTHLIMEAPAGRPRLLHPGLPLATPLPGSSDRVRRGPRRKWQPTETDARPTGLP